ncbi:hypothetical protein QWJ34_22365 [Saccharibacillus sp. CPCC 101409]|uniref:hypothetical protein n=1 Tax=Saccharibacillus sp. CPCC 101409 TaxID=3058041 RepID=UPI00267333AC|nr:hypothetical protein [Saccharibacillus sp. CPCC 101409]MDO3412526.1 hypothetical protein [Saccharibacillus sp. CPCC 101409]
MSFDGAVIERQGATFAVVAVKLHVLGFSGTCEEAAAKYEPCFPDMPIVLMSQDADGVPKYCGDSDCVAYLSELGAASIPWQTYTSVPQKELALR